MFYLVVISLYIGFCVLVVKGAGKLGAGKRIKNLIVVGLFLLPFWDQLVVQALLLPRRFTGPYQEIKRTVDAPESVLWIDEVWPGFDEYGQYWMVKHYLDGKHLKTLGLSNGKETLVYTLGSDGNPVKLNPNDPQPRFKYTVHFTRIQLPFWQEWFLWCDEIRISDNVKNEDTAFSRRYLGYKARLWPSSPHEPFNGGARMGDELAYEFDDKVLFRYAGGGKDGLEVIKNDFSRSLYTRIASDWKSKKGRE